MTRGENKWTELKRLGIREYIECQVTAAEAAPKPAPDGLLKCANDLGLAPDTCLFIGDSRVDITAGKNAGMKTAAISGGVAQKEKLQALKPDYIFKDLESLRLYLSRSLTGNQEKACDCQVPGSSRSGTWGIRSFYLSSWVKEQFISKLGIDALSGDL